MLSSWKITTQHKWLLTGGVCATALAGTAFPLLWESASTGTSTYLPHFAVLVFIVTAALAGFFAGNWWRKSQMQPETNPFFLEEDERLQLWEELSQAGQWYYDLKTHNFTGTQTVLEIYGLKTPEDPEEKNKAYDVIEQRVHPKDHDLVLNAIQKTLQGEPQVLDYRIIVDGKIRYLHTKRMPHYDALGNIIGIYGCSQDITELVEAKLAARTSEHRMRKLIEKSQLLICTIEPENLVVTFHNKWYETALGYTRDEFAKLTVIEVTHPDDRLKSKEAYDNITSGKSDQERFEKRYITKDGSLFTVDLSLIAIRDPNGHLESIIAVAVDISDRKRIEEELRKSEERLRIAATSGNIGMWDWNPQTGMVYWTAESFTMIGYPAEEAGLHPDYEFFNRVYPQDLIEMKESLRKHYEGETDMYRCEFRIRCADGRWIWNLGAGKAVEWTEDGKPLRVTGIQVDINQQKQLELDLIQAREDAEKANVAKSTFLANMSHEIRTPMTAILGFTELLESTDLHEEEAKEFLRTIQRNGQHLLELINDILDLSKIDSGQFSIDRQLCDYWAVVKDVINVMRVRAEKQNIELELQAAEKLPNLIDTDAIRFRQSLINLIGNAIKFTEKGSVRLQVNYLSKWKEDQPAVQFQVIDTGIGIEPDKIETLFDPFVQADESMSRKRGGTGLGLAITKQITEMLDGEVSVESEPGKGSTFTIVLPVGDISNLKMVETSAREQEERERQESLS